MLDWINNHWEIIDRVGTLLGIASAMVAAWNARKLRQETKRKWQKSAELIRVILRATDNGGIKELTPPVDLKRGELTRAELLGLIGMIPMKEKGKRFELGFFNTGEFLQRLAHLRDAEGEFEFVIPCTTEEISQFKVEAVVRPC